MTKSIFVVFSEDEEYAKSWGNYIRKKSNIPYDFKIFSDLEKLRDFSSKENIDVLLLEKEEKLRAKMIFVLYEKLPVVENEGFRYICKFQSANDIISQIAEICTLEGKNHVKSSEKINKTKVIGIYSPINRCLKTIFSVILAKCISKNNSALYLNFEEYSALSEIFPNEQTTNLSDLLFYYKQGAPFLGMRFLAAVSRWDNLDYIFPPANKEDVRRAETEELISFLEALKENGDYKYFVIDLGSDICEICKLLEYCDEVIMPIRKDTISKAKLKDFEKMYSEENYKNLEEKIVKVDLSRFEDSFTSCNVEHLENSELGGFVKEAVKGFEETKKWNLSI